MSFATINKYSFDSDADGKVGYNGENRFCTSLTEMDYTPFYGNGPHYGQGTTIHCANITPVGAHEKYPCISCTTHNNIEVDSATHKGHLFKVSHKDHLQGEFSEARK